MNNSLNEAPKEVIKKTLEELKALQSERREIIKEVEKSVETLHKINPN